MQLWLELSYFLQENVSNIFVITHIVFVKLLCWFLYRYKQAKLRNSHVTEHF